MIFALEKINCIVWPFNVNRGGEDFSILDISSGELDACAYRGRFSFEFRQWLQIITMFFIQISNSLSRHYPIFLLCICLEVTLRPGEISGGDVERLPGEAVLSQR